MKGTSLLYEASKPGDSRKKRGKRGDRHGRRREKRRKLTKAMYRSASQVAVYGRGMSLRMKKAKNHKGRGTGGGTKQPKDEKIPVKKERVGGP